MKCLILSLFIIASSGIRAQMSSASVVPASHTIGKVMNLASFIGELSYTVADNGDTVYALVYRNYLYSHIEDRQVLVFSGKGHAADSLYAAMKSCFLPENKKNKEYMLHFTLGGKSIYVAPFHLMGTSASIHDGPNYGIFTEKQLDKLFGKR